MPASNGYPNKNRIPLVAIKEKIPKKMIFIVLYINFGYIIIIVIIKKEKIL